MKRTSLLLGAVTIIASGVVATLAIGPETLGDACAEATPRSGEGEGLPALHLDSSECAESDGGKALAIPAAEQGRVAGSTPNREGDPRALDVESGEVISQVRWKEIKARLERSDLEAQRRAREQRVFTVSIALDPREGLPPDPYRLVIELRRTAPQGNDEVDGTGAFDVRRQTSFIAASLGLHEVAWILQVGGERHALDTATRQVVEVEERREEQRFALFVPPETQVAWQTAVQRIESSR